MKRLNFDRPVKQKRALLESNPPRDSWIERRRNKIVSTVGEAKTSPTRKLETFISEPEHALTNSSENVHRSDDGRENQKPLRKNYVSSYPFFRSKRSKRSK
jgi:hypothetical protein